MSESADDAKDPWFKFYVRDWRGNDDLQTCSLAARALWLECLTIMHHADPHGHLVRHGQPMTEAELARMARSTPAEVRRLLRELREHRIGAVTEAGVWYSPRLLREHAKRTRARANGALGGNPAMLGASVPRDDRPTRLNRRSNPTKVAQVWDVCHGRCSYCGIALTREDPYAPTAFQIDHVIPIADGGTNDLANLRGACRRCNFAKGIGRVQADASVNHITDESTPGTADDADKRRTDEAADDADDRPLARAIARPLARQRSETRDQKDQDQDHRAVRRGAFPDRLDKSTADQFRQLCALVRKELQAHTTLTAPGTSDADVLEHMKGCAARAHLPYASSQLRKALDAVQAARRRPPPRERPRRPAVWDAVLARIEQKVQRHHFFTWFVPVECVEDGGDRLTVQVPNALFRDWHLKHYSELIAAACAEAGRAGVRLVYEVAEPS